MTRTLQPMGEPVLPEGYMFDLDSRPPLTVATVKTAEGELAASGRLGLIRGLAVFDRIRTQDGHRRRGLARALMAKLGNIALHAGVSKAAWWPRPRDGCSMKRSAGACTRSTRRR